MIDYPRSAVGFKENGNGRAKDWGSDRTIDEGNPFYDLVASDVAFFRLRRGELMT